MHNQMGIYQIDKETKKKQKNKGVCYFYLFHLMNCTIVHWWAVLFHSLFNMLFSLYFLKTLYTQQVCQVSNFSMCFTSVQWALIWAILLKVELLFIDFSKLKMQQPKCRAWIKKMCCLFLYELQRLNWAELWILTSKQHSSIFFSIRMLSTLKILA